MRPLFGGADVHEVGFTEDAERQARLYQVFRLAVLAALLVACEPVNILITHNQKGCFLGDVRFHSGAGGMRHIGRVTASNL